MAGKPKRMSQVKQILRMHKQGKGIKTIARTLSISKNTVKGYIKKARAGNLSIEALLAMEDPVLEGKIWPGNPAYKDERYEHLKTQLEYYSKELKKVGVTRQLLWDGKSIKLETFIHIATASSAGTSSNTCVAGNPPWYWTISPVINFLLTTPERLYLILIEIPGKRSKFRCL